MSHSNCEMAKLFEISPHCFIEGGAETAARMFGSHEHQAVRAEDINPSVFGSGARARAVSHSHEERRNFETSRPWADGQFGGCSLIVFSAFKQANGLCLFFYFFSIFCPRRPPFTETK